MDLLPQITTIIIDLSIILCELLPNASLWVVFWAVVFRLSSTQFVRCHRHQPRYCSWGHSQEIHVFGNSCARVCVCVCLFFLLFVWMKTHGSTLKHTDSQCNLCAKGVETSGSTGFFRCIPSSETVFTSIWNWAIWALAAVKIEWLNMMAILFIILYWEKVLNRLPHLNHNITDFSKHPNDFLSRKSSLSAREREREKKKTEAKRTERIISKW